MELRPVHRSNAQTRDAIRRRVGLGLQYIRTQNGGNVFRARNLVGILVRKEVSEDELIDDRLHFISEQRQPRSGLAVSKTLPETARLEADICIVGGGLAGIVLARELIGKDRRVLVLESGGRTAYSDPKQGVVDADCRVHGVGNLFIAGPSVFPTGGYANPVLTVVALTVRLADHTKKLLENNVCHNPRHFSLLSRFGGGRSSGTEILSPLRRRRSFEHLGDSAPQTVNPLVRAGRNQGFAGPASNRAADRDGCRLLDPTSVARYEGIGFRPSQPKEELGRSTKETRFNGRSNPRSF
jgi:hypothetical protein